MAADWTATLAVLEAATQAVGERISAPRRWVCWLGEWISPERRPGCEADHTARLGCGLYRLVQDAPEDGEDQVRALRVVGP